MITVTFKALRHPGVSSREADSGEGGGQQLGELQLELSPDATHDAITSALAARIGLDDPARLRVSAHGPRSGLATLLGASTPSKVLYYKVLGSTSSPSSPVPATTRRRTANGGTTATTAAADDDDGEEEEDDPAMLLDQILEAVASEGEAVGSLIVKLASSGKEKLLGRILVLRSEQQQLEPSQDLGDAIFEAVKGRQVSCLRLLLRHASSSIHLAKGGKVEEAAIHVAAKSGDEDCTRLLLQHEPGAQVAATDAKGWTALMQACWGGHAACVSLLLEHEPEKQVLAASATGCSALMMAAEKGHPSCMELLLEHQPDKQVITASGDQGAIALMLAAQRGHALCVRMLLEHQPGRQVMAATREGLTALICAASSGEAPCVELLLMHEPGRQLAATDAYGMTALMCAAELGHWSCIELLLQHSPENQVGVVDRDGHGPLALAAGEGHSECVSLLLSHRPDLQDLDAALLWTTKRYIASASDPRLRLSQLACIRILMVKGAWPNRRFSKTQSDVVKAAVRDHAAQASVPSLVNEAVVGLALEVARGRKRRAPDDS